jgi:hypothetical protein
MIDKVKNWWNESIYEISPPYRTYIPSKRKGIISILKFGIINGLFIALFVFLFIKKGVWFVFLWGLGLGLIELFTWSSYLTKEVELRIGKKLVKDKTKKYVFTKEQKKLAIKLSLVKIALIFLLFFGGMFWMSLAETQIKFISENDLAILLEPGDTLYARNSDVDVSYREAENTFKKVPNGRKRIRYNYFYKDAYTTSSFVIGTYQRLNFLGYQDSLSRKFFAIKPLHSSNFTYQPKYSNDSLFETILDDSFLFVEPFQVTISPEHYSRLVSEGKKWDFRWW